MKKIPTYKEFLNEISKANLEKTDWSKYPTSKQGDVYASKRQGAIAVHDNGVLRPIRLSVFDKSDVWLADRGFETDKQFTSIDLSVESIEKAWYEIWSKGKNSKEDAGIFAAAAFELVNDLLANKQIKRKDF
jgi:hypothetical protein